jgi:uncharacterized membrane protein
MRRLVPVGRVVGVDLARLLALVGMMATHIVPSVDEAGRVTALQEVAGGRSSALFAMLAGVSLSLAYGRTQPVRGRAWGAAAVGICVRAALVAFIGLLLGGLGSGIAVILTYYGLLFLAGIPFLRMRASTLAVTAAVWLVAAPVVSHLLRPSLPDPSYRSPTFPALGYDPGPAGLLTEIAVTGYYPVLVWMTYLLAGMAVGRTHLSHWRPAAVMAATGAVLWSAATLLSDALLGRPGVRGALVRTFEGAGWRGDLDVTLTHGLYGTTPTGSPWWLAVRAPHSGTSFDLAVTSGSALVVLAGCIAAGLLMPRLIAVLSGAGAMTLTLYTAHVISRQPGWWDADDLATWWAQVLLAVLIGAGFRLAGARGPLEAVVGDLSRGAAGLVRRGERSSVGSPP